jgi:hypothetical protein
MGERVTISYRGAAYQLGRGKNSYGIWPAGAIGAPGAEPVERWPETPEGWNAAWYRFTRLETPGSIVAAGSSSPGLGINASTGAATALLTIGILAGVIGLFPHYLAGQSLASQPVQLVPHVAYLAAWTLSAVLILLGGVRQRAGALLGVGTSVVTFGLFFADVGWVVADGMHIMGAGVWFSLVGWLACTAGSVLACFLRAPASAGTAGTSGTPGSAGARSGLGRLGLPRGYEVVSAVLVILAGIGAAIAFAPAWDRYLVQSAAGNQSVTAGNAFSSPGWVIAGNLAVMIGFGLVVILAALWRPLRLGAMLLAGAVIAMAVQAISALIQVGETTSPASLGIQQAQGVTISNGVTPAFWVYCILLVVLVVSCVWMLIMPAAPVTPAVVASAAEPVAPVGWDTEDDIAATEQLADAHAETDAHDANAETGAHAETGADANGHEPEAGKSAGIWS